MNLSRLIFIFSEWKPLACKPFEVVLLEICVLSFKHFAPL